MDTKHIDFVDYQELQKAQDKLTRHSIDLIIDYDQKSYWVNELSPKSYLVEKIFQAQQHTFKRNILIGEAIRYVDWVLPGILGMNMMFSCLLA